MAKVALIQPHKLQGTWSFNPSSLGLSFISSDLKAHGHDVLFLDVNEQTSALSAADEYNPDYIGLRLAGDVKDYKSSIKILKTLLPKAKIIVGGPSVALNPRKTLEETVANFGVMGDGIPAFREIMGGNLNAPGIVRMENGELVQNGFQNFNVDSWEIDPATIPINEKGHYTTITSMGCYGRCSFCNENVVSPKIVFRDMKNVLRDVETLQKTREVKIVSVLDPNFLMKEGRLAELASGLAPKNIQLSFQARANDILARESELREYAKNIMGLEVGVESFIEPQLKRYNKKITVEQNMAALDLLKSLKIDSKYNLILGDRETPPEEAIEEFCMITQFFSRYPEYLPFMSSVNLKVYEDGRHKNYPNFMKMFFRAFRFSADWVLEHSGLIEKAFEEGRANSVPEENKEIIQYTLEEHFRNTYRSYKGEISKRDGNRLTKKEARYLSRFLGYLFEPNFGIPKDEK